jgi:hypothetical protein
VSQARSRYGNAEANKAIAAFHERGIL